MKKALRRIVAAVMGARGISILAGLLIVISLGQLLSVSEKVKKKTFRGDYCRTMTDRNVEAGEALIHGLESGVVAWSMPAYSVANALICHEKSLAGVLRVPTIALMLCGLIVFGIGAVLGGVLAGAAGLAVYAFAVADVDFFNDRWLFTLSVALTAFLMVWRARRPSLARGALLAVALGLSMNILSALLLLPPLLTFLEWARTDVLASVRMRLKHCAVLLLLPYLFLLPWISMNWNLGHGIVPFERGRADCNVITGALGLVGTVAVNARELASVPQGQGAFSWAVHAVFRHPVGFLAACAARMGFVARIHPFLLALCLPLWFRRNGPARRQLGLMIGYFLLVHCLMSVEDRYFTPMWPVVAAGCAAAWRREEGIKEQSSWPRWLVAAALAPLACLVLYAMGLAAAYPQRIGRQMALERELKIHPEDAWLLSRSGLVRLREGKSDEAADELARALALTADSNDLLSHALALFIRGGPDRDMIFRLPPEREPDQRERRHILLALCQLSLRRPAEAISELEAAMGCRGRYPPGTVLGDGVVGRARRAGLTGLLLRGLSLWPFPQRGELLSAVGKIARRRTLLDEDPIVQLQLDEAARAVDSGHRGRAGVLLRSVFEPSPRSADVLRQAVEIARQSGDRTLIREALSRLVRLDCGDAQTCLDLAELEVETGGRAQARVLLRKVLGSSPRSAVVLRRAMGLALKSGDAALAKEALSRQAQLDPGDAQTRLDLVVLEIETGGRARARVLLRSVLESFPRSADVLRRAAQIAHKSGEKSLAREALSRLAQLDPGDAQTRLDLAELEIGRGNYAQARALWRAVLESSPPSPDVLRRAVGIALRSDSVAALKDAMRRRARLNPGDVLALLELAGLEAETGNMESARSWLAKAQGEGGEEKFPRQVAAAYRGVGESRQAVRILEKLVVGSPRDAALLMDLAESEAQSGLRERSAGHVAKALSDDDSSETLARAVRCQTSLGEYARALAIVEVLLRRQPKQASHHNDRAVLLGLMGRKEEAERDLREAIAFDGDRADSYLSLGSLLAARGRTAESISLYDAALARRTLKGGPQIMEMIRRERERVSSSPSGR